MLHLVRPIFLSETYPPSFSQSVLRYQFSFEHSGCPPYSHSWPWPCNVSTIIHKSTLAGRDVPTFRFAKEKTTDILMQRVLTHNKNGDSGEDLIGRYD